MRRLDQLLANLGYCSRREARGWIQAGRVTGTLVNAGNVERYTRLGVRVVMTSFFPWIHAGASDLIARAAAGARG